MMFTISRGSSISPYEAFLRLMIPDLFCQTKKWSALIDFKPYTHSLECLDNGLSNTIQNLGVQSERHICCHLCEE